MLITKRSTYSGKIRQREINVTEEQLTAWKNGMVIQDIMPNISVGDREFIMTGMTQDEWDDLLNEDLFEDESM